METLGQISAEIDRAVAGNKRVGTFAVIGVDGRPAPNVKVRLSSDGRETTRTTDRKGSVRTDDLPFAPTRATVAEDPREWIPLANRMSPLKRDNFDLDRFLLEIYDRPRSAFTSRVLERPLDQKSVGSSLAGQVSDYAFWIGGALLGQFNDNPTIGQIVLDTAVTMIPVAGTIGDARDLVAIVLRMEEEKEREAFLNWLCLGACLIGLVPIVGSALRGAYKILLRDYVRAGGRVDKIARATAEEMLAVIRALGLGDPHALLRRSSERLADEVVTAYRTLVERVDAVLKFVEDVATAATRRFAQRLRKIFNLPKAEEKLRAAIAWLHEKALIWLDEGLKNRPAEEGFRESKDAFVEVLQSANSSTAVTVKHGMPTSLSVRQTLRRTAGHLTATEWRAATHTMFDDLFKDTAEVRLKYSYKAKKYTYSIWLSENGLIYGTYRDLENLSHIVKEHAYTVERLGARGDTAALEKISYPPKRQAEDSSAPLLQGLLH
jgi:hypothetical protein